MLFVLNIMPKIPSRVIFLIWLVARAIRIRYEHYFRDCTCVVLVEMNTDCVINLEIKHKYSFIIINYFTVNLFAVGVYNVNLYIFPHKIETYDFFVA